MIQKKVVEWLGSIQKVVDSGDELSRDQLILLVALEELKTSVWDHPDEVEEEGLAVLMGRLIQDLNSQSDDSLSEIWEANGEIIREEDVL